jgi:trk system potassium uptake protein TrkA
MHDAADNTACALLARSLGIPRIIGRLRHQRYEEAYKLAGITTVVHMSDIMAEQIMSEIEQPRVKKIISLENGQAQIHTVRIPAKARSVGLTIREIAAIRGFPKECVFVGIYREGTGDYIIPRGDTVVLEEDTAFLISKGDLIHRAADILLAKKRFWQI